MSELRKWQLIESKMVLNHHFCQVRQDKIALPTGDIIDDFFVHIKPDVALVLPITKNREIVFVRQYRHAIGDFYLELPAGGFNPDQEDAKTAALRELEEETGYIATDLQLISILCDRPSKDTNRTHLFLATDIEKTGQQKFDLTEEIEVVLEPIDTVYEKIRQGKICVMGTVTAVLLGLQLLGLKNG